MKSVFLVLMVVGFAFLSVMPLVAAEEILRSDEASEKTVNPVDAGNKICPVSGEKIVENLKATYEYDGKIYNFCCAMCIDEFKKDPQKYIKKVDEELQSGLHEGAGSSMHQEMQEGSHHRSH